MTNISTIRSKNSVQDEIQSVAQALARDVNARHAFGKGGSNRNPSKIDGLRLLACVNLLNIIAAFTYPFC